MEVSLASSLRLQYTSESVEKNPAVSESLSENLSTTIICQALVNLGATWLAPLELGVWSGNPNLIEIYLSYGGFNLCLVHSLRHLAEVGKGLPFFHFPLRCFSTPKATDQFGTTRVIQNGRICLVCGKLTWGYDELTMIKVLCLGIS